MEIEDLFKFVSVRPVQAADPDLVDVAFTKYGDEPTPLHKEVLEFAGARARFEAAELARRFMRSNRYVAAPPDVTTHVGAATTAASVRDAKDWLEAALGAPVHVYLRSQETRALWERLWDSLYAQVLAPDARPVDRNYLYEAIRAIHFLGLVAKDRDDDAQPMRLDKLQRVTLLIPPNLVPAGPRSRPNDHLEPLKTRLTEELEHLTRKVRLLRQTMVDVRNGNRTFLAQESRRFPVTIIADTQAPVATRPVPLRDLTEPMQEVAAQAVTVPAWVARMRSDTLEVAVTTVPRKGSWPFGEFGNNHLSEATKGVLAERRAHLAERAAPEIVTALRQELARDVSSFLAGVPGELVPHFAVLETVRNLFDAVPLANPPFRPVP